MTTNNVSDANEKAIVWAISTSGAGSHTGINDDLSAFGSLDCQGVAIITGNSTQDESGRTACTPVADEELLAQLNGLLPEQHPKAIKIGLLANQAQVLLLASWLNQNLPEIPRVVAPAPVLNGSDTGCSQPDYRPLLTSQSILTLEVDDVARLSEQNVENIDALFTAGSVLHQHFDSHLVLNGGSLPPDSDCISDILWLKKPQYCSERHYNQPFLLRNNPSSVNTGQVKKASLSAAIAAFIACDWTIPDAVILGKAFVAQTLHDAQEMQSSGFPQSFRCFPEVFALNESGQAITPVSKPFAKLPHQLNIYPVVDSLEMIAELLKAGCTTLQLRVKTEHPENIAGIIAEAITLGKQYQAQLFINDHWQLALQLGAFGVHLGQEDLQTADLQAINEAGMALGLSSHSYFEALLAMGYQPSYLALGHIFPTTTKTMPSLPQGLYRLSRYAKTFTQVLPTVAIGGIDQSNLSDIKATGIGSAAVVRAVTLMADPGKAFSELKAHWESPSEEVKDGCAA